MTIPFTCIAPTQHESSFGRDSMNKVIKGPFISNQLLSNTAYVARNVLNLAVCILKLQNWARENGVRSRKIVTDVHCLGRLKTFPGLCSVLEACQIDDSADVSRQPLEAAGKPYVVELLQQFLDIVKLELQVLQAKI